MQLLAYGIAELDYSRGLRAWRWIFIIEGGITAFVAIIAVFLIADFPEQCRFLNADEKMLLHKILAEDGQKEACMDTLNKKAYKRIFSDWKIWLASLVYLGVGLPGYSLVFFMPTILFEFGWKAQEAQVHSIPVYAVTAVAMLLVAYLSDRYKHRYGFIILGCVLATVGCGMLLGQAGLSREAKYGALFFTSVGGYIATPMGLAWLANNVCGHWKRAFSAAIQVTIGNFAGLIASNIFLENESPYYRTGYGVILGFTWLGGIAATALFIGLRTENRIRDSGKRDYRLSFPKEELNNLGDDHPSFRFAP